VSWERYAGGPVAGDVRVSRADRDLHAYLPPSYERSDRRFPGLYMHDGQNLFDATTSFAGEWGVDETMEELAVEGLEAIVIGIPHGEDRVREYTPFNGCGDEYLAYVVDTVKPLVDSSFRTLSDREHTGIMGSSLGALISL